MCNHLRRISFNHCERILVLVTGLVANVVISVVGLWSGDESLLVSASS